jgi:hypothetical protein
MTTISKPTIATKMFSEKNDWQLVVVGDTKTPHHEYEKINCIYLHPDDQDRMYPELSLSIGWKSIQRRNIGFVYAYHNNADIIATVDDDNIPYENWGTNLLLNKEIECDYYKTNDYVFDPLSVTKDNYLWHRGYPVELIKNKNNVEYAGKIKIVPKIQADLWDGDPDIDAIARMTHRPTVKYDIENPYCSNKISPFNSQNTFIHRDLIPYYAVLPFVGRMDDIWGGYIAQHHFPNSLVYNRSSVFQDRNEQDLVKNLEDEIIGYRNTSMFLKDLKNYEDFMNPDTKHFWMEYRRCFS